MKNSSSHPLFKDITGQTFGRLTVLKYYYSDDKGKAYYLCKCTCNNKVTVGMAELKKGNTKSCGCLRKEVGNKLKEKAIKHGDNCVNKRHKLYSIWAKIIQKCTNKNHTHWKYYGGRGITYDPHWSKYENFKKDMYFKYLYAVKQLKVKDPSIERIDVNGNYCFDNCCFIEKNDQGKNKTNSKRNKM